MAKRKETNINYPEDNGIINVEVIKVKALPAFYGRRFMTLSWPESLKEAFRKLKAGGAVDLEVQYFDSNILEKVEEDGNS